MQTIRIYCKLDSQFGIRGWKYIHKILYTCKLKRYYYRRVKYGRELIINSKLDSKTELSLLQSMRNIFKMIRSFNKVDEYHLISKNCYFQQCLNIASSKFPRYVFGFPKLKDLSLNIDNRVFTSRTWKHLIKNTLIFPLQNFTVFFKNGAFELPHDIIESIASLQAKKFLIKMEADWLIPQIVETISKQFKGFLSLDCPLGCLPKDYFLVLKSCSTLKIKDMLNEEQILNLSKYFQSSCELVSMSFSLDKTFKKPQGSNIWNFLHNLRKFEFGLYFTDTFYDILDLILSGCSNLEDFSLSIFPTDNIKPLKFDIVLKLLNKSSQKIKYLYSNFSNNIIQLSRSGYLFPTLKFLMIDGVIDLTTASNMISICNEKTAINLNSIQIIQKAVVKFAELLDNWWKNKLFQKFRFSLNIQTIDIKAQTFMGFLMKFLNEVNNQPIDLNLKVSFEAKEKANQYDNLIDWTNLRKKSSYFKTKNKHSFDLYLSKININHELFNL